MDKKENINVKEICKEFNVSSSITSVLQEFSVIQKIGQNKYEWNSKIPITIILVKKVIQRINEKMALHKERKYIKQKQIHIQQTTPKRTSRLIQKQFENIDSMENYLSIAEAITHYGKSESTIRNIVRLASKKKSVIKHEILKNGNKKIYISVSYLDSIFNKKNVRNTDIKQEYNVQLGVIRKFLKWLW